MNTINLMGRLTATPEPETTPNGIPVLTFTLAVARPHTKDKTDFIRCVAWRNTAEFIAQYFTKGKMMALTGTLTTRSWKDEKEQAHKISEVLVDAVFFCGDKKQSNAPEQTQDEIPQGFTQFAEQVEF